MTQYIGNETPYDIQFREICSRIIEQGELQDANKARAKFADGKPAPAVALFGESMTFDALGVPPVPTTKRLFATTAVREMLLFWQQKTNHIDDFKKMNVSIWNEWIIDNPESEWHNTIGPAYGWQLGQRVRKFPTNQLRREHLNPNAPAPEEVDGYVLLDQVDFLIQSLLYNPESRQLNLSLWDVDKIDEMALPPCVWSTTWAPINGVLNLMLNIRSNDMALGNAFNVYQYYVLLHMIAQVTGLIPGTIKVSIANAHLYKRHIPEIKLQLNEPTHPRKPMFVLNRNVRNFYAFTDKDAVLTFYGESKVFKYDTAI